MEHDSFDDPIFGEFGGGPLNPLGAKPLLPTTTAMHPVMLGSVHELCSQQQQQQQRLPDCNTILPNGGGGGGGGGAGTGGGGSPNYVPKLDFVNKIGCYSPSQKYEYITAPQKLVEQHQHHHHQHYAVTPPPSHNGILLHKHSSQQQQSLVGILDYHPMNGKMDYSPSPKDQYEPQQQQQLQSLYGGSPHHLDHMDHGSDGLLQDSSPVMINGGSVAGKLKKTDEMCGQIEAAGGAGVTPPASSVTVVNGGGSGGMPNGSDTSSAATGSGHGAAGTAGGVAATAPKKDGSGGKKKGDPNGIKKKKTR